MLEILGAINEVAFIVDQNELRRRAQRKYYRAMKRTMYSNGNPSKRIAYKKKKKRAKIPRLAKNGFPKEYKFYDETLAFPTYTSNTMQSTRITNMSTGALDTNIIGDKALLKSASVNVTITAAATTAGTAVYRVIMVYGRSALSLFSTGGGICEFQNTDYTDENVVLYDKMKVIDCSRGPGSIVFRGSKKLNHLYQAQAGWNVYVLIKTTGTLTTAAPTTTGLARVRFTDT